MITSRDPQTNEIIEQLVTEARRSVPESLAEEAASFVRQYYYSVPGKDMAACDPLDLKGAALAHLQLSKTRAPEQHLVRAYNPSFERHGWQSSHTIIEVTTRDNAFLVDSVTMALHRLGLTIHLTIHPIIEVLRNEKGDLQRVMENAQEGSDAAQRESFMQFQVSRQTDPAKLEWLQSEINRVLSDVSKANGDWRNMRDKAVQCSKNITNKKDPLESQCAVEFMHWIAMDHFTFLGYCEYLLDGDQLVAKPATGLGVLRSADVGYLNSAVPHLSKEFATCSDSLTITKSNLLSTVHHAGYMDMVSTPIYNDQGELQGRHCFLGLFAASAYRRQTQDIPYLKQKIALVIEASGIEINSHDGKALMNTIETFPRDALLQYRVEDIAETVISIVDLQERQRVRLFGQRDYFGQFCTCITYIPRERYSRELRLKFQELLMEATQGTAVDFDTSFSSTSTLARINYVIQLDPQHSFDVDWHNLEEKLINASRSWDDKLLAALTDQYGEELGNDYYARYGSGFPSAYREDFSARVACIDIESIEAIQNENELGTSFYQQPFGDEATFYLKVFKLGNFIPLSIVIPMLENMGLAVDGERPYQVKRQDGDVVWIHEFALRAANGTAINPEKVGAKFTNAFKKIWAGSVENDGFNRLVLQAGLDWRDTVMLRSYCKYLLQIQVPFSQRYMVESLVQNTPITQALVDLFQVRFNPDVRSDRDQQTQVLLNTIHQQLEEVSSLDEDRILRSYMNLIEATLRTNFFQKSGENQHKDYLSFKFDPSKIPDLPLPKPMYEIFVCSPRVEAVHLRGGKVARGGLRWSDRREDFRTEVLGLVKAQMVKNSVIVPVGSKGGFYVKRPPTTGGREAFLAEGIECYKTFLRGLLDITDNLVDGENVPPNDVIRYDGDDPYLVIAADKGTATFSDIANSVSEEYGFWLGDAFASGGSNGYDHKGMGITARGAWESVKRHFRELGLNTQAEDFSVVGVGDMGGDVFGNGMLLSEHIKLVGAFNHLHIFLDPDPDPVKTYQERLRLFQLPRSSWEDFNKELISKGGGIFSRSSKSIPLSPEIREVLDIEEESLAPNDLINRMLKSPVDLLWNGGIGTYIKASDETHADAADRANDATRISGNEVRAKVVGEGGNLGVTQRARIELSQHNVLCYTDAVDNSAGVDCSDHEVNIKILLAQVVEAGDMTTKQRNELLEEMTDEVGDLVLKNNYQQTQCISRTALQAPQLLSEQARFIQHLEEQGQLNRELEFLPSKDIIADRLNAQQGLTRPELSVLVSYAKMTLFEAMLETDLAEDEYLAKILEEYFPKVLSKRFASGINQHRLKREIISTCLTNEFVNRLGPTVAYRLSNELNASPVDVMRAYVAVRDIFDLNETWKQIETLDNQVSAQMQMEMAILTTGLVERSSHWFMRHHRKVDSIREQVEYFQSAIKDVLNSIPDSLAEVNRISQESRIGYFVKEGVPEPLAARVASVVPMSSGLDIVEIAVACGVSMDCASSVYFNIGAELQLQWLRDEIHALKASNHWHMLARSKLRTELHKQQRDLAAEALQMTAEQKAMNADARVTAWVNSKPERVEAFKRSILDMIAVGDLDFAMLSLIINEVQDLLDHPRGAVL